MRSSGIRAISIQKPFPTFAVIVSGGGAMIPLYSKEGRHLSLLETKRWLFGLCDAMDGGYKGWNPYIERHLAIFVNSFRSRAN